MAYLRYSDLMPISTLYTNLLNPSGGRAVIETYVFCDLRLKTPIFAPDFETTYVTNR